MLRAAFCLHPDAHRSIYGEPVLARLPRSVRLVTDLIPPARWVEHAPVLAEVEILFSGWGLPRLDADFLAVAPKLKAVLFAGGDHRYFASEAFWRRGIRLSTANALNAIPVSEYTVAAIVLGLKRFWHFSRQPREGRHVTLNRWVPGNFRRKVALISYGTIARLVRRKLTAYDVEVLVYDPFLDAAVARAENLRPVSLAEAFATADAVSLHTPSRPETRGMIKAAHFAAMRSGAVFINTARGDIVDEAAMIAALKARPDVQAILDVTRQEPPEEGSPLYHLENVVMTPHIAGSLGGECARLGFGMMEECERYVSGQRLAWEVLEG
jgi:phosphoglycerate dehydrogenase-like enzyme